MKFLVVSIFDRSVEAYQPLGTMRAKGQALRNFMDMINDPQSGQMHTHPDDFDLYIVGYFDDNTGLLQPLDAPEKLGDGKQLALQLAQKGDNT